MREKSNTKIIVGIFLVVIILGCVGSYLLIPSVNERISLPSFQNMVSAYGSISIENLGTLKIVEEDSSWQNIKATGDEENLIFWTANKDLKKTEIGWIPKSGSCTGWTDKILYDKTSTVILNDKDKSITLKCESSKCDGSNCYHISLTEAEAVNIDSYIKIGESSSVLAYQNESRLEYDLDFGNLNITLLKNVSGEFNTQINDIFVYYSGSNYKFGANDSSNEDMEQYKYLVESSIQIYNEGSRYYVRNPSPILDNGIMKYNSYEAHNLDFGDICSKDYGENQTAECSFNQYEDSGKYYLEVTFLSDSEIDPQVVLGEADVFTNAVLNNVTLETNFSHLYTNATGLEAYYSWDGQSDMATAFDLSGNGRDCTAGVSPDSIAGKYGTGSYFSGDDYYTCTNEDWNLGGQSSVAVSFWFYKEAATATNDGFLGNTFGRPIKVYLFYDKVRVLLQAGVASYTTGTVLADDAWYHVAFTYTDGDGTRLYINNVQQAVGTSTGSVTDYAVNNRIGGLEDVSGLHSNMDDLMIFSRALTTTEISNIYNSQFGKFEQRGEQVINDVDVSDTGGESFLNITLTGCETNLTENLTVSVGDSGGAYTYGSEYQITDCFVSDIPITTPENISIKLIFNSPTGVLTPYGMGDIILDSWIGAGGDTDYPVFTNIHDNNATLTGSGLVIVNATITSTNGTAWVTFDGTDYQMDNVSTYFNTSFNIASDGLYIYNISSYGNGTSALLNRTQNYEYTINTVEDFDYPVFTNPTEKPTDGIEYNPDTIYEFNITISSTNGSANINFDSTNYSLSNISSVYNWTTTGLDAGVHSYNYSAFGNGTLVRFNISEPYTYTIVQNSSYFLNITGTTPITYGTATDVAGTGCPDGSCTFDFPNAVYEAGTKTFNYSFAGDTNYIENSTTKTITINQAIPEGTLTNNKAWNYVYDTLSATLSISETNTGDGDLTYEIYVDNVSEGTSYTQAGVGNYGVVLNTTGGTNYTANSSMYSNRLIITQQTTSLSLIGTSPISYGTPADITGSGCPAQLTCELFRNDTVGAITNPDVNATLPVGIYLYTYNTTGNTNYTSDSETFELTITAASQTAVLTFNETSPKTYPYMIEADCNGELWRNDVDVNTTENGIGFLLPVASHNYSCQLAATGELAYDEDNQTFIINIGAGVVDLKINGTEVNLTIEQSSALDLNATLTTGESDIEILIDGVQIVTGSSPIGNNYNFTSAGYKNISAHYTATQNYSIAWDTLWVNVTTSGVPVLNITYPFGDFNTTNNGLEINYTIDDSADACWWTNNSDDKNYLAPCGTNITGQTWDEGSHNLTIYANNSVDNIAQESRIIFIDTIDPYFVNFNNRSSQVDVAFSYTVQATDDGIGIDCFSVDDGVNFKIDCSGLLENNTAFDTNTTYTINVTVNDSLGHQIDKVISVSIGATGELEFNYISEDFGSNPIQIGWKMFGGVAEMLYDNGVIYNNTDHNYIFDTEGGTMGLGTAETTAKLVIGRKSGNPSIKADSVDGYMIIDSAGHYMSLNHYVADDIILANGGGNVGIGDTSPDAKLQVNGHTFIGSGAMSATGTNDLIVGLSQSTQGMNARSYGNIVHGRTYTNGNITAQSWGSFAGGYATEGTIYSTGFGSFAHGSAQGKDLIASGTGSIVQGTAREGDMTASGSGSGVMGFTSNYQGGNMLASGDGAFIFGTTRGYGQMLASGEGSFVIGRGYTLGNYIQANGAGSFAGGLSTKGNVTAKTTASFAFGMNVTAGGAYTTAIGYGFVNDDASSFAVGYDGIDFLIEKGSVTISGEQKGSKEVLSFNRATASGDLGDTDSVFMQVGDVLMTDSKGYVMARAGSITGISFSIDVQTSTNAPILTARIKKNGATVYYIDNTMGAGDNQEKYGTQARGTDVFAAGDVISVEFYVSGATSVLAFDNVIGTVEFYYDS